MSRPEGPEWGTLPRLAGVDHHFCETLRIPASFFLMKQEIMGCAKKIRRRDFCLVLCSAPADIDRQTHRQHHFFCKQKRADRAGWAVGALASKRKSQNIGISGLWDCGLLLDFNRVVTVRHSESLNKVFQGCVIPRPGQGPVHAT